MHIDWCRSISIYSFTTDADRRSSYQTCRSEYASSYLYFGIVIETKVGGELCPRLVEYVLAERMALNVERHAADQAPRGIVAEEDVVREPPCLPRNGARRLKREEEGMEKERVDLGSGEHTCIPVRSGDRGEGGTRCEGQLERPASGGESGRAKGWVERVKTDSRRAGLWTGSYFEVVVGDVASEWIGSSEGVARISCRGRKKGDKRDVRTTLHAMRVQE